MTQQNNDGGPAFPPVHDPDFHASGMSLRDWFAGQYLMGRTAQSIFDHDHGPLMAKEAYIAADSMLAERSKKRSAA
jgi:hypothetical protein